jgi:hypothetical protein
MQKPGRECGTADEVEQERIWKEGWRMRDKGQGKTDIQ